MLLAARRLKLAVLVMEPALVDRHLLLVADLALALLATVARYSSLAARH